MYQVSFSEAENALRAASAAVTVAEGHGCLCGALCTLPQFTSQNWLQELMPDPAGDMLVQAPPVDTALAQLFDETQAALQSDAMEFVPLLPDDSAPIADRIQALAQWSQGFLYGFGIGAPHSGANRFTGDIDEVLKDLSEIAHADEADLTGSDEEETAYTELVEYLRAAVQLIHDEFAEQRAAQRQQRPLSH